MMLMESWEENLPTLGRVYLVLTIDGIHYPDTWTGHGHAFEPEGFLACLPFGVSHIDELFGLDGEWNPYADIPLDELREIDLLKMLEEITEALSEIQEEFEEMLKYSVDEEPCYQGPLIYGWLHLYKY